MSLIRAFAVILFTFLWSIVGIVCLVIWPPGHLFYFFAMKGWGPHLMRLSGIDLSYRYVKKIDWDEPCIICANHNSQLDIPALFSRLPVPIRFWAKRGLFRIPLFGWMLHMARFVPIDRGNGRNISFEGSVKQVRKGPPLTVFPEGTRSPDGKLQPFKSGAFVLASMAGVPILPVAIKGTFECLPKSRFPIEPGPVEIIVGEPIPAIGTTAKDKTELRKKTRQAIEQMLETGVPWTDDSSQSLST